MKRCDGRETLIAVNAPPEPCEITFEASHKLPAQVKLLFEDRTAPAAGKRLTLSFKPLEVHVVDLGPAGR